MFSPCMLGSLRILGLYILLWASESVCSVGLACLCVWPVQGVSCLLPNGSWESGLGQQFSRLSGALGHWLRFHTFSVLIAGRSQSSVSFFSFIKAFNTDPMYYLSIQNVFNSNVVPELCPHITDSLTALNCILGRFLTSCLSQRQITCTHSFSGISEKCQRQHSLSGIIWYYCTNQVIPTALLAKYLANLSVV